MKLPSVRRSPCWHRRPAGRASADREARRAHRGRRQGRALLPAAHRSPSGWATSRTRGSTSASAISPAARARCEAVVGGSADVVSGAYEHTINMQSRKQYLPGLRAAGRRAADQRRRSRRKLAGKLQVAQGPEGAQGRRQRAGLEHQHGGQLSCSPRAGSSRRTCRSSASARARTSIAAMDQGRVDVISQTDPAVTMLEKDGKVKVIAETRTLEGTEKLFGGPMPAASLYAPIEFVKKNPNTVQALTNAMVRALIVDAGGHAAADPARRCRRSTCSATRRCTCSPTTT